MTEKELYQKWLECATDDADLQTELKAIAGDDAAISDRFYRDLEFGTGGLRGVIGAGTYRMNVYTVRRATQGLANYVNSAFTNPSVAISYDSRIKSDVFAKAAAEVLAANGIKVHIYTELMPTPMLSYAVRAQKCSAGIMVTASHNPAKYNGYKVYLHTSVCNRCLLPGCAETELESGSVRKERSENRLHTAERHWQQAGSPHSVCNRHQGRNCCSGTGKSGRQLHHLPVSEPGNP